MPLARQIKPGDNTRCIGLLAHIGRHSPFLCTSIKDSTPNAPFGGNTRVDRRKFGIVRLFFPIGSESRRTGRQTPNRASSRKGSLMPIETAVAALGRIESTFRSWNA